MYPEGQQILVIDDDERRRELIEHILIGEGFAVTAVAQGFSAIHAAASRRFALAVAAVNLPGTLDGPTTMRQLRGRQPWLKPQMLETAGLSLFGAGRYRVEIDLQLPAGNRRQSRSAGGAAGVRGTAIGR